MAIKTGPGLRASFVGLIGLAVRWGKAELALRPLNGT